MLRKIWAVAPLILVISFLTTAYPPRALGLQLSDLTQMCRVNLRDTASDANFQRFSDASLAAWINEGQRDVQNKSWVLQGTYTLDLAAGVRTYQTPGDFLYTIRVLVANKRITQTSYNQLDAGGGGTGGIDWTVISSTPTQYFLDILASSVTLMGFYPLPKLTTTGGAVRVQYAQIPQTLALATDLPFDGKSTLFAFHDVLVHYCAMKGWAMLSRPDLSAGYSSLYAGEVATIKMAAGQMPDFNPGVQGYTGPPGQR